MAPDRVAVPEEDAPGHPAAYVLMHVTPKGGASFVELVAGEDEANARLKEENDFAVKHRLPWTAEIRRTT